MLLTTSRRRLPSISGLIFAALFAVLALCTPTKALAFSEQIQLAASADGRWIAMGGENRAVWIIDTQSWSITQRIWVGAQVGTLGFSQASDVLFVLGDDGVARLYDPATGAEKATFDAPSRDVKMLPATPVRPAMAIFYNAQQHAPMLELWSLSEGRRIQTIDLPTSPQLGGSLEVSPDGQYAYFQTLKFPDEAETSVDPGEMPTNLYDKVLWEQRKDGFLSNTVVVDIEKGEVVREVGCFFSGVASTQQWTPNGLLVMAQNWVFIIGRESDACELKISGESFPHPGVGPGGELYVENGDGFDIYSPELMKLTSHTLIGRVGDRETITKFALLGQDRIVALTDASRLMVIVPWTGAIIKAMPCY